MKHRKNDHKMTFYSLQEQDEVLKLVNNFKSVKDINAFVENSQKVNVRRCPPTCNDLYLD